jgi:alanyl-tRNA synthetase
MHASLRKVLGEHVRQAGSLVEEDRLRFDFNHFKALTEDEISRTQSLVRGEIKSGENVSCVSQLLSEAKLSGALMFFADKYESEVRVVEVGDFSKEFCGGTHLKNTKEVLAFKIIQESSIAKGVRRIEALTGKKAIEFDQETDLIKAEISFIAGREDPNVLNSRLRNVSKRLSGFRLKMLLSDKEDLFKSARVISGVRLFTKIVIDADKNILRSFYDNLAVELKENFVIVLGATDLEGVDIVVGVSKDGIAKGLDASNIVKAVAVRVGGSGGGRPDFAQAGGSSKENLLAALEETESIIKGLIK